MDFQERHSSWTNFVACGRMEWWEAQLRDKEWLADLPKTFQVKEKYNDDALKLQMTFLRTLLSRYPDLSKLPDGEPLPV